MDTFADLSPPCGRFRVMWRLLRMVLYSPDLVTGDYETDAARAEGKVMAQRTLFAGPSRAAPEELYALAEKGVMVRERDRVILDGHALVTTITFFGRFPA